MDFAVNTVLKSNEGPIVSDESSPSSDKSNMPTSINGSKAPPSKRVKFEFEDKLEFVCVEKKLLNRMEIANSKANEKVVKKLLICKTKKAVEEDSIEEDITPLVENETTFFVTNVG